MGAEQLDSVQADAAREQVSRIPFGIDTLDGHFGGLPAGSAVLLAGARDAGVNAFSHTLVARAMTAAHDPDEYPGTIPTRTEDLPTRVRYVSLSNDRTHLLHELDSVLSAAEFDRLTDHMTLHDRSMQFADVLAEDDAAGLEALLETVQELLVETASEELVVFDSLTSLVRATTFDLTERDLLGFLLQVRRAVIDGDGLALIKSYRRAELARDDELLNGLLHGNIFFYSNDQGFETQRTMRIGSFGGVMDRKRQSVYRTLITPSGFAVKSTRKISPTKW
jgi:KaiC/GvpD/RAD55 family RecA-like ATPase